jgi:hypothetical protein
MMGVRSMRNWVVLIVCMGLFFVSSYCLADDHDKKVEKNNAAICDELLKEDFKGISLEGTICEIYEKKEGALYKKRVHVQDYPNKKPSKIRIRPAPPRAKKIYRKCSEQDLQNCDFTLDYFRKVEGLY